VTFFKPQGIPLNQLDEVVLTVEEYEALRLADLESKPQVRAAGEMGISQPTFNRLLTSARNKVAEALVRGKAIKVSGGHHIILAHTPESEK